jgi:rhamnose utilization protein RhaD (predicted bifunctional aldolase and dehydrogenase)
MRSRWNDAEAQAFAAQTPELPELGLRVYTSRLLGSEPALVLHGGGNTSFKPEPGGAQDADLLYVKGSGSDLATVRADDFAVVRLTPVRALIGSSDLDNDALARAVAGAQDRPGPKPSIETLLHAVLPRRFVEHTHADSMLAITNTRNGAAIAEELFGELAPLVPFRHSGFALARAAHEVYSRSATSRTIGLILLHHGVFAFGNTAQESYENMLRLVSLAEDYLERHRAWTLPAAERPFATPDPVRIARLRAELSRCAGFPLLLRRLDEPEWRAYARRPDLTAISQEGPATPQHAVFIKREPMLGIDVEAYARRYQDYVRAGRPGCTAAECGLDPAPRVVLDANLGVWAASVNEAYLSMTMDILRQDMEIKTRAAGHDRYQGLPAEAILEAEIHYGGFERRLYAGQTPHTNFLGEVVLMCVAPETHRELREAFQAQGAAVIDPQAVGLSVEPGNAAITGIAPRLALLYGGVDVVIADAGWQPRIDGLLPLLAQAPAGGRLLALGTDAASEDSALARRCADHNVRYAAIDDGALSSRQGLTTAATLCRRSALVPSIAGPGVLH